MKEMEWFRGFRIIWLYWADLPWVKHNDVTILQHNASVKRLTGSAPLSLMNREVASTQQQGSDESPCDQMVHQFTSSIGEQIADCT